MKTITITTNQGKVIRFDAEDVPEVSEARDLIRLMPGEEITDISVEVRP